MIDNKMHKNTYPSIIDYSYLGEGPKFHFRDKGEFLPAAYAMAWCMEAAGFYRIFTS